MRETVREIGGAPPEWGVGAEKADAAGLDWTGWNGPKSIEDGGAETKI